MAMMKYSKGGETTNVHVLYWNDCLFWGMYRVRGLALMAKSIQALCEGERSAEKVNPLEPLHTPSPRHTQSPEDRRTSQAALPTTSWPAVPTQKVGPRALITLPTRELPGDGEAGSPTSFFSKLHSDMTLSPCSWKVMMIKATKMFTKKKGKTTK